MKQAFREPPMEARPRLWWHWINGNITQDGLLKDLAWMHEIGIGGVQAFDANLQSPQIVDKRLVYMTPEWKAAFAAAVREADRLGMEFAIASSPGWSETGGPWVEPADGMKKLVWSEIAVEGVRGGAIRLPMPPTVTGPYQSIAAKSGTNSAINNASPPVPAPFYRDAAVLAFPEPVGIRPLLPQLSDAAGKTVAGEALFDGDLETAVELPKDPKGGGALVLNYPRPLSARSLTLYLPGSAGKFIGANLKARLEARSDAGDWRPVVEIPLSRVPTTLAFAPVAARTFRISFTETRSLPQVTPPAPGVDLSALAAGFMSARPATTIGIAELDLSDRDRIDRAETKAGFDVAPDYYALDAASADTPGIDPGKVVDLTGRLRADGSLDWTPPKGRWRIMRLGYSLLGTMNHPAPIEATGLEVDKYDAAAVGRYMDRYLAMYRDAAGVDLMGKHGIRAILTDSIEVGPSNWTADMIAQFRRLRGYDPVPWLPALTGTIVGSRGESERFLYDFRRTLADLLATAHYGTVAKVAHDNGLTVYGEALEDHRPLLGDDMAMRRATDVPMAAMWAFPRSGGAKPTYIADMKGAASVAHLYGQRYVAAESLTSMLSPWAYGPAELKRMIDFEFTSGINRPIIHTSVHVPVDDRKPGLRLSIFGQDFNRNEAWGALARPWIDYIARNAFLLQQGVDRSDIAYFHGEEAPLTALFGDGPPPGMPAGYAYDFVNADALQGALTNDGADLASQGGARYRVLYLGGSSRRMSLGVLRRIAGLVEQGATVVGLRPAGDPGLSVDPAAATEYRALLDSLWPGGAVASIGKGRVVASQDLAGALDRIGIVPDVSFTGAKADSKLPFVHRHLPDGEIYFVSNQQDRAERVSARFRVSGKVPELWHAETGTFEPASFTVENGVTTIPLTLGPDEAVHIVFRRNTAATGLTVPPAVPIDYGTIEGPWQVAFEAGRGAPPRVLLDRLAPLNENLDPAIRHFSGTATYSRDFAAPRGWKPGRPLRLDLGALHEVAEVRVNGRLAGYSWHRPFVVDIAGMTKPGRNHLEVRVANLWVNRLIGDAQPGTEKVTWTATATYRADAPLRPSGLIGPVRLTGEQ
ncbi:glycosyl hydrolase [Novosphingobium sp. BL-8A]|uniref:glycosyl hydrolase n=1 Tax=Novosphingobium sp. BL-8A TaxID=3127639 RepID=UPI0037569C46